MDRHEEKGVSKKDNGFGVPEMPIPPEEDESPKSIEDLIEEVDALEEQAQEIYNLQASGEIAEEPLAMKMLEIHLKTSETLKAVFAEFRDMIS